ncbi:MAG: Zinc metalloprotease [Candidatus Doudnabacteria bacterium]|nr:Zinc metalloprotease [Candidatus Doudnabacteria bacterium]
MLTIIVFILILAALVLFHEFGHFIIAKKSGMQVDEFGFGFPPRIWGKKIGETTYTLNAIPLGGFVKIAGENNDGDENPRSFINKSFTARLFTLIAGVIMNFVLAWILFSIGFTIGLPTVIEQGQTVPAHGTIRGGSISILQIDPNSPAAKAGITEGDVIISLDGHPVNDVNQVIDYIKSKAGSSVDFQMKRGNTNEDFKVTPRQNPPPGEGAVGIALGNVGRLSFPFYIAPIMALKATWQVIVGTASGFYHLIFQGQGVSSLGGPVKIAKLTGQVTQLGLVYILQFAAFLSVNLGILNIMPFPALDGGRVLFLIIEKVRGKRNNSKIESWFNTIGFALLMVLVLIITVKDIRGLF